MKAKSTSKQPRMTSIRTEFDPDRLPSTLLNLFRIKQGEMLSALMHLGTRLNLWEALTKIEPCSSEQLAQQAGLQERWVREWLHGMAAADIVQHEQGRFALTPEARVALTDSDHWSFMAGVYGPPMTHREIARTAEAFRSGVGMTWDEHGDHACHMQCAMSAARQENFLVSEVLASFDGVVERLNRDPRPHRGHGLRCRCGFAVASSQLPQSAGRGY